MLWGIGVAELVNNRSSMALAELRARAQVVQQIKQVIHIRHGDDVFNNLFELYLGYVNITASFAIKHVARVSRQWIAPDGTSWSLVEMRGADVAEYFSIIENILLEYHRFVFQD